MIKKKRLVLLLITLLVLSSVMVSAGWFSDLFKRSATGKVIAEGTIEQWASSAEATSFYNADRKPEFATGEKNGACTYWKYQSTWCKSSVYAEGYITLKFNQKVYASSIDVYFTGVYLKNFEIDKIELQKPDGSWDIIWQSSNRECLLSIGFEKRNYLTDTVKITTKKNYWGCIDAVKLIGYEDVSSPQVCTENWVCASWTSCSNNIQTRTCTDNNRCQGDTDEDNKKTESQSCASVPLTISNIKPSGIIESLNLPEKSVISFTTSRKAHCTYSINNNNFEAFINTDSTIHNQTYNLYNGTYNLRFKCEADDGETIHSNNTFEVRLKQAQQNQTCTDSDGGLNYSVKGTTTDAAATKVDSCSNDSITLSERYCMGNALGVISYTCPNGCKDGACVIEEPATEVDGCGLLNNEIKLKIKSYAGNDYVVDSDGHKIILKEGEKAYRSDWVVVPGAILNVSQITNQSYGWYNDRVIFTNVLSGDAFEAMLTGEGKGTVTVGELIYNLRYYGDSASPYESRYVILDFPQTSGTDKMTFECDALCSDLINKVKNPSSFTDYDIDYDLSWNSTYKGTWWIDGSTYGYTAYYASWYTYYYNENEKKNLNYYFSLETDVFDDSSADLKEILEDMAQWQICKIDSYWSSQNEENKVYVCNWDFLRNEQNIDYWKYTSREVLWFNENVLVRFNFYFGETLSDDEINKIIHKKTIEFINDLKSNEYKYVGWEHFNIPFPLSNQVCNSLYQCPSEVSGMANSHTNETCYSCWNCKIEPVICPGHGFQKRTCVDNCCEQEKKEEQIYCSPGMCSGCYVPRWFGSSDNKCIPYGFRFGQETSFGKKLEEHTGEERLEEREGDDVYLEVLSEDEAVLILYDRDGKEYKYILKEGEKVNINIPGWQDDIEEFTIEVISISYSLKENVKSYVDMKIYMSAWVDDIDYLNAYCDIDGEVKMQKTKAYDGSWAKCQNSYECESNLCSGGECVEINTMIKEASGAKVLVVKILCKISSILGLEDSYEQCLVRYLGGDYNSENTSEE